MNHRADIYSIGCILNFLLTGRDPGVSPYGGNHYIVNMIERATNEDSSYRYASAAEMKRELEHLLGKRLIDRIPFVCGLPGFRSHTPWKAVAAGLSYGLMLMAAVVSCRNFSLWSTVFEIFLPVAVIPLILFFNMGNLQRFFPKALRRNNRLFFKVKIVIALGAICLPIFLDWAFG